MHQPGVRTTRPITVEITEETGKPVGGAAVSFHLPEDGPSGLFLNGLRTEVMITDPQGHASLKGFLPNRVSARFQVRILASKEQARAGTVSFQYVAEPRHGASAARPPAPSRWKWVALGAAIAGGAVAGMAASRGGANSTVTSVLPATPPIPVLTIGAPGVSVGKP